MSTSLLYHGFGINGYKYVRTHYKNGSIIFTIRQEPTDLCCPICGSRHIIRRGRIQRMFKTIPIGKKPVFISIKISRVFCIECKYLRQVKVSFAEPRKSYTKVFERYVLELSHCMTIQDIARHLRVSWDVIKDIQKKNLKKRYDRPKLKHLKQIAIDEISIGKRHKYLTVVLDLSNGAVVFVGDGKGADALSAFWKRINHAKANIEAVAIDMSPAYIQAVSENLKEATIVFDHFHVVKLFNDKLSDFRRKLYHEAESTMGKNVLKGTRWLLLKNPENLNKDCNESERLEEALELNKPLSTAYYMKEDLRQLWSQPDKSSAKGFLDDWIKRARASTISMLIKFANTLAAHLSGILSYYDFPISTGPLEVMNNKIKTMKRQAYGFRDLEFIKLKIMAIHKSKYALVG